MGDKVCAQLSDAEKRKSLSCKKKKRRNTTVKVVLDTPGQTKYSQFPKISVDDPLNAVLIRDLSTAKINTIEADKSDFKAARKDLSIGINSVSRHLRASNLSAVLLACDVTPEVMIGHVFAQCQYHKVPSIRLEAMRKLTMSALGFECIALGFLKDRNRFNSAVSHIKALSPFGGRSSKSPSPVNLPFETTGTHRTEDCSVTTVQSEACIETKTTSVLDISNDCILRQESNALINVSISGRSSDGNMQSEATVCCKASQSKEKVTEIKSPHMKRKITQTNSETTEKETADFIVLDDDESEEFDPTLPKGISHRFTKNDDKYEEIIDLSSDEEEPVRKFKKNWVIDTNRYLPPKVVMLPGNPERKHNFCKNMKRKWSNKFNIKN